MTIERKPFAYRHGLIAICAIFCFSFLASAQENTGTILGIVTDASGAVVPNATLTATSQRTPRGVSASSDSTGHYIFANLPVGVYTVEVTATGFSKLKQENVDVQIGSQFNFNPKLAIGATTQVVEVADAAISLDTTSSRTDTTITQSTFDNLYKGRTFNSILAMAPGVRQEVKNGATGVGGIQVDGSSGLENTYYLDGVEVSDIITGGLRSTNAIPLDFISELQIKSGGFEAENGGATGGVVNVAIRNGANAFHGSGYIEYTGDPTNAGDRGFWQRSPTNVNAADFFRPKEDSYSIWYPGFTLGGRIIRDRLFFFVGDSPELEHTDRTINYTTGAKTFKQDWKRHYGVGRLDYAATSKLQIYSSYIWAPQKRNGSLPNRDPRISAPSNDLSIQGGYTPSQAVNAGATYSLTPRLIFSARYGYKYLNGKDGNYGIPTAPYVQYLTASPAGVPTQGGVGFVNVSNTFQTLRDVTTRHNVYLDGTFIKTLFGQQHTFKAGYALNRVGNDVLADYPNGFFTISWNDAFTRGSITNKRGQYGYYTWEDGVKNNSIVHGRNQGVYIQDQWRIHPRVTLNLGVRLENEYLPPYTPVVNGIKVSNPVAFDWGQKIAPRLGGAWDVLGDGKWKVSGSFGLFYDVLKYNLARGSFGGEYWMSHVYTLDKPDVLSLSKTNPGALGTSIITYDNREVPINPKTGALDGIDPDIKPYKSRDINFSLDHQLANRLVASVRYTRKDLLTTIEDIGVLDSEDNEVYLIGNPGFGQTRKDPTHTYDGKTPNGNFLVPKAVRQYDGVEFRLQGQIGRLNLIPSYTWSRLYGNYSGLGNSDESGRANPNNNRAFDLPYYYFDDTGSQKNVLGLLGTDRPHTFKLFASYDLKTKAGDTFFGLNQVAYSGTNDSTSVIYLSAPTYPYGRGDIPRTPVYTQTDLYVGHEVKITERTRIKFEAEIRNLFNQAAVISRDSQINRTGAISEAQLPIKAFFAGYDPKKFVFPGSVATATTIPYNAIYGLPGASYRNGGGPGTTLSSAFSATNPNFGAYQDFRTIRLGLKFIF